MAFQWGTLIIDPNIILGFIIALVILIVGYFVGALVGHIVKKGIEKTKLEKWLEKTGRMGSLGGIEPPRLIGALAKWWVFSLAVLLAADTVELTALGDFLYWVATFLIPKLLVGILIVIAGLIIADFAYEVITKAKKLKWAKVFGMVVKVIITVFAVLIALDNLGIQVKLAEYSWYIILGGLMLAFAISFGLAFKKQAEKIVGDMSKKL